MSIASGISSQQAIGKATDIVFDVVSLGYSRKDEFLADKLAVKYARNAGFNPYGMITFFKKIAFGDDLLRFSQWVMFYTFLYPKKLQQEAEKKGGNFHLVFLSSHPKIEDRIKNVENGTPRIKIRGLLRRGMKLCLTLKYVPCLPRILR